MNGKSKDQREQLPKIPSSIITSTVHYENSNGFVPMMPSISSSHRNLILSSPKIINFKQRGDREIEKANITIVKAISVPNTPDTKAKKFEEDLTYSSEARIFLNLPEALKNRRTFDSQETRSNFELLKINNDTPTVANYQEFYKNMQNAVNTETEATLLGRQSKGRGRRIENYIHNYRQKNEEEPYVQYPHNNADMKKPIYEPNRHAATVLSSSRSNHEINELSQSGSYDNMAEPSRIPHKFSKPVVVAEPNNDKTGTKSNSQKIGSDMDYKTSENLESSAVESSEYDIHNNSRQRSYHSAEDSKSSSDESIDSEYIERSRNSQKNRRRPLYPISSKRLPKEHRIILENSAEESEKRKYSSSNLHQKLQRHRMKTNPWTSDDYTSHHNESTEDIRYDSKDSSTEAKSPKIQHGSRTKHINAWDQVSPNIEISHSNGIILDQVEKPKLVVPVKVDIVPVANFDHATALGNSQGFDASNALLQNFVTASPLGAFNTHTPVLSTEQPILSQNLALSKNLANVQNFVSTPMPDLIVGQSTFQNPVQTVLLSEPNGQHKAAGALKTTYLPSTITPVFAVTSGLTPALQNLQLQNVQNNVTPRAALATTPTSTAVIQQIPINQMQPGMQQFILPQPTTIQAFSNFLQTPLQANSEYQIQVNPHGLQGQTLLNNGNLQLQSLPTTSTLLSGPISGGKINLGSEVQKKNTYPTSDTNLLASANLIVGQNEPKQAYQVSVTPKTKGFVQTTQMVPTILQSNPTFSGTTVNAQQLIAPQQSLQNANFILQQPQQYIKLQNNGGDNTVQQLQLQLNRAQLKNNRIPGIALQTVDNVASHSNILGTSSGNAHLPSIGTRNVEILNPNIKPNAIDNAIIFNAIRYPAVVTTPIPIFSTITPQTVSLQSYVDSLTETGAKAKQLTDLKTSSNQERPIFNPSNFIPNVDIIKNQNALNNKLPINEPIQHALNLVPVMPGGNFFKPSYAAQNELMLKPKLASDLQKYAEEMFKESLKTMYNSQKWNNDRRPNGLNYSETSDLVKLQNEMQKYKNSLSDSKYRDFLEAHQSENKLHATDSNKFSISGNGKKKLDPLLASIENILKTRPPGQIQIYHDPNKPIDYHKYKPSADSDLGFISGLHDNFNSNAHLTEFLTPPRPNTFHVKSPFHNKPIKKRPSRYKNGLRSPPRSNNSPLRPTLLEPSASNVNVHFSGSHFRHRKPFYRDKFNFDPKHLSSFNAHSTFSPSPPDFYHNILKELREANNKDYDINHPKVHNLLGLLMKNKQLPNGYMQNQYRDNRDQVRQLYENRQQQPFYDDVLKPYFLDKSDDASQSDSTVSRKVYPGNVNSESKVLTSHA